VKPTAPALKAQWVFRCTAGGTAGTEPVWTTANNSTIATGGVTFTNVTGQSTYGWTAAAGDIPTLLGAVGTFRFTAGDRMFVSSDHTETQTANAVWGTGSATASYTGGQVLSVNRAGSTPPVAADLTAGASVTQGGSGTIMVIEATFPLYHYGISYIFTSTNTLGIRLSSSGTKTHYFDSCQLYLNTSTASVAITSTASTTCVLYNSTLRFGATSQGVTGNASAGTILEFIWLNTASALAGATFPTTLFAPSSGGAAFLVTARGVDLSALTGTLVSNSSSTCGAKYLFDSCRIASGVTRYNVTSVVNTRDVVELINCYDGSNFLSESYQPSGAVTTEFVITLSGGAQDNVGTYSHKMVSNTNIDKYANPLNGFWMDVNNVTVGGSRTATVEIVSSAALNNDEISLIVEYQGTVGSSVASFVTTLPTTILTTAAAVTTSTATWNSLPATPATQKLVATFTPQVAGRVRAQVRLGKASTTCYYNPQVFIS
jgi:hypothetical protein